MLRLMCVDFVGGVLVGATVLSLGSCGGEMILSIGSVVDFMGC